MNPLLYQNAMTALMSVIEEYFDVVDDYMLHEALKRVRQLKEDEDDVYR